MSRSHRRWHSLCWRWAPGWSRPEGCHVEALTPSAAWVRAPVAWPLPRIPPAGGFQTQGFRFFFYSNEGNPRESVHVHVRAGGNEAKLWLQSQVRADESYGFDAGTSRELVEVAQANSEMIERAWHDYFG